MFIYTVKFICKKDGNIWKNEGKAEGFVKQLLFSMYWPLVSIEWTLERNYTFERTDSIPQQDIGTEEINWSYRDLNCFSDSLLI